MESSSVFIQMKATEKYFSVVLFLMLYKMEHEAVDEMLECSMEMQNAWVLLLAVLVGSTVQGRSQVFCNPGGVLGEAGPTGPVGGGAAAPAAPLATALQ